MSKPAKLRERSAFTAIFMVGTTARGTTDYFAAECQRYGIDPADGRCVRVIQIDAQRDAAAASTPAADAAPTAASNLPVTFRAAQVPDAYSLERLEAEGPGNCQNGRCPPTAWIRGSEFGEVEPAAPQSPQPVVLCPEFVAATGKKTDPRFAFGRFVLYTIHSFGAALVLFRGFPGHEGVPLQGHAARGCDDGQRCTSRFRVVVKGRWLRAQRKRRRWCTRSQGYVLSRQGENHV